MSISPFANESQSETIGGLTIENHVDRIAIYGDIDITKDMVGRAHARKLRLFFDEVIRVLESEAKLPDVIQTEPPVVDDVPNPFA
ncbi:MAG: hypothetical protein HQM06_14650 [Magnetococcales bacterium]|nr:hypothetical protein [Magnetococcales bacterium]